MLVARMMLFERKGLWAIVRWTAAIIVVAMALGGCARQLTIGVGCSRCRTPVAVKTPAQSIVTRGKFVVVGDMTTPRAEHIAILLDDGRVLIAGGETPSPVGTTGQLAQLRSAEIYDPGTRKFEATDSMRSARLALTAVLLRDGNVLFVGGSDAEIYDVNQRRFAPTGGPIDEITSPLAVMLNDGNVLVCGDSATSCEIYFSKTGKFRETSHTHGMATSNPILLPDGRALFGVGSAAYYNVGPYVEIFDPETETFRALRSPRVPTSPPFRLDDGRIFLGSELLDPANNTFTDASGFVMGNSVALLQSGRLLIAGGIECRSSPGQAIGHASGIGISPAAIGCSLIPTAKAWLYDPRTQMQVEIENMNVARRGQTATSLKDGSVLIAGGRSANLVESSAEVYVP
jgi:hypothetical protein